MYSQERLESKEQPASPSPTLLGESPPSLSKVPPEVTEAKKAVGNRRRTTSNTRHRYTTFAKSVNCFSSLQKVCSNAWCCICFPRRDTFNEDNHRSQELLHFSSSIFGELVVHRGKSLGERDEMMQLLWLQNYRNRPILPVWCL